MGRDDAGRVTVAVESDHGKYVTRVSGVWAACASSARHRSQEFNRKDGKHSGGETTGTDIELSCPDCKKVFVWYWADESASSR